MVATHLYIGFQYKSEEGPFVDVSPFLVIPSGTYNNKNQYEFYYTINSVYYSFLVRWTTVTWELIVTYPIGDIVALIPDTYSQEEYPGITSIVNWDIQPEFPANIYSFYSYTEEENIPDGTVEACTYWFTENNIEFPAIWQNKVLYMMSDGEGLFVGQVITSIVFDNGTPSIPGNPPYHIGAILYTNDDGTLFSTNYSTIYSQFVGIILLDVNNNYVNLIPNEESYNTGTICLAYKADISEEQKVIDCYNVTVWNKQCQYSKAVEEYSQSLVFGTVCCNMLEKLKQQHRVLQILNCYDPRDIYNDTTIYNNITYSQIQQLLNY